MSNSERSQRNLSNKKISFIQQQIPKQSMITQEQPQQPEKSSNQQQKQLPIKQQTQAPQVIVFQPNIPNQPNFYQQANPQPILANPIIQPNNAILNQPLQPVIISNNNLHDSSSSSSEICPYCNNRVELKIEKHFNCCTCLYYFFMIFLVCLAIINGNCSCNCNCDCNCCNCNDIYYVCPNCKKVVNKYDSCKEKCKGCCSIF